MGKKNNEALAQVKAILAKAKKRSNDKGGGARKYGRYNTHPSSMRYKGERRWERNRVRRMERHLREHPNDAQARSLLGRIG